MKNNVNYLIRNTFSPFLFAARFLTEERNPVVSAAGQKSVFELRYNGSRDRPENSNLIGKQVNETTENCKKQ